MLFLDRSRRIYGNTLGRDWVSVGFKAKSIFVQ